MPRSKLFDAHFFLICFAIQIARFNVPTQHQHLLDLIDGVAMAQVLNQM